MASEYIKGPVLMIYYGAESEGCATPQMTVYMQRGRRRASGERWDVKAEHDTRGIRTLVIQDSHM